MRYHGQWWDQKRRSLQRKRDSLNHSFNQIHQSFDFKGIWNDWFLELSGQIRQGLTQSRNVFKSCHVFSWITLHSLEFIEIHFNHILIINITILIYLFVTFSWIHAHCFFMAATFFKDWFCWECFLFIDTIRIDLVLCLKYPWHFQDMTLLLKPERSRILHLGWPF